MLTFCFNVILLTWDGGLRRRQCCRVKRRIRRLVCFELVGMIHQPGQHQISEYNKIFKIRSLMYHLAGFFMQANVEQEAVRASCDIHDLIIKEIKRKNKGKGPKTTLLNKTYIQNPYYLHRLPNICQHRRCSSSHNSQKGNASPVTQSKILLSSSTAHSNSNLTSPNNVYRHICYCLSSVKQFEKYKQCKQ